MSEVKNVVSNGFSFIQEVDDGTIEIERRGQKRTFQAVLVSVALPEVPEGITRLALTPADALKLSEMLRGAVKRTLG